MGLQLPRGSNFLTPRLCFDSYFLILFLNTNNMLNTKEEVTSFMFRLGYFKKESKSLEKADYFTHRTEDIISGTVETTFVWFYTLPVEENLFTLFKQIWVIAQAYRDYQTIYELGYKEL